jgi:hypothetical protein
MKAARRTRMTIAVLAAFAVLGCVTASAILAAGQLTTIRAGNLVIEAEGAIRPTKLPRHEPAPISVHVRGSVATADGSHVPPAKTVHIRVDKHIRIDTTGLPICHLGEIRNTSPAAAMHACGDALFGKGSASAEVAFPEQAPFTAEGRLLAFNGPRVAGYSEQLYYVYVAVPAPTALIVVAKLSKASGLYGYQASVTVPRIAGGSGSFVGFDFVLGRRWTYKGRRHSYMSAECPDGRFVYQLEAVFADGSDLKGTVLNRCQAQG